jgi:NAD(P)-dependent dehydrogenase (short-subunit alcohol dehydrogenase family)
VAKKPLAEQVVVVTGASSGLGRAIARRAGARHAKVVVAARNGEALDAAAAEIEASGGEALAVPGDLANADDVAILVERALMRFGRIDTVICSTMVTVYSEVPDLTDEELQRVFDVNFFSRVRLFWAALPALEESRGTFVDVNSALAYRGIPLQGAYCATKAAMRTFLESARTELEKRNSGVSVCCVLPGAINTPQFDRARQRMGFQPQPVPPIYEPEPFADAVLHCAEQPVRELPLGWGAQKLLWGQKLSPRLGDLMLLRIGWKGQHTDVPKPVAAADNLFETMPGDPGAHGRFDGRARGSTAWTTARIALRSRPAALALLGLAAPAAAAALSRHSHKRAHSVRLPTWTR